MSDQLSNCLVFATTTCTGAPSLFRGQLKWFSERGWQPIVVCNPDEKAEALAAREGVEFRGISMQREIALAEDFFALVSWYRLMRQLRPFAVNVGTPKAGLLGGISAWLARVPRRIYTVRGLRLEGSHGFKYFVLWLMERIATAVATDVIVVSTSLGVELRRRKLVKEDKVWITANGSSNGVDVASVQRHFNAVGRDSVRKEIGIAEDLFVVGFFGRLNRDKGIDTLLAAFETIPDQSVHLLIVGNSEENTFEQSLSSLGSRVHEVGWTSFSWQYLAAIDVLALPTLREGFPNVVLEAAAVGIPAITTFATGAVDSVVNEKTGLLVEAGDPQKMAEAIVRLACNPELRSELGNAAQERALKDFRQEPIWQAIEDIVENKSNSENARKLFAEPRGRRAE